jgi:hypothetical protein
MPKNYSAKQPPPPNPPKPKPRLPYRPETMAAMVAATEAAISAPSGATSGWDCAWVQGMSCWGEGLIPGRPADDAYATRHVEVHGDTLCLAIAQGDAWYVIEIDEPVGWDPVKVTCQDAKEVRRYTCDAFLPHRGWAACQVTTYTRQPGHPVFQADPRWSASEAAWLHR